MYRLQHLEIPSLCPESIWCSNSHVEETYPAFTNDFPIVTSFLKSKSHYNWRSVKSACLGIEHPCGTCDKILLPVGVLLSEICGLISVKRPLWREDGSAICSVITQWSESRRTSNHTLLSHLRSPPTWRARFPYLYPPGTGWLSYTPGFPLRGLLRLAGLRWRYLTVPQPE
jgi:hypothetical protein